MSEIRIAAILSAVRAKPTKDGVQAELVFVTDQLRVLGELVFHLGQQVNVEVDPWQQRLWEQPSAKGKAEPEADGQVTLDEALTTEPAAEDVAAPRCLTCKNEHLIQVESGETAPCPDCTLECPECDGTGDGDGTEWESKCDNCSGSGRLIVGPREASDDEPADQAVEATAAVDEADAEAQAPTDGAPPETVDPPLDLKQPGVIEELIARSEAAILERERVQVGGERYPGWGG